MKWILLLCLYFSTASILIACGATDQRQDKTLRNAQIGHERALYPDESQFHLDLNRIGKIQLDPNLNSNDKLKLARALKLLSEIQLDESSQSGKELKRLLNSIDLSGPTLIQWIEERIQVILAEPSYGNNSNIYGYNWGGLDLFELDKINKVTQMNLVPPHGGRRAPGIVTFYSLLLNSDQMDIRRIEYSRAIYTLATFFHEARHSDGNQSSQSFRFGHALCPPTSPHRGDKYCDPFANGPNAIQYHFIKAALESCRECSTVGKDMLRIALYDTQGRFDYGVALPWGDPRPELYP